MNEFQDIHHLSPEQNKARRKRNLILAAIIIAFMGIVFAVTVVRMKDGVVRNQDWQKETAGSQTSPVVQSGEGPLPQASEEQPE